MKKTYRNAVRSRNLIRQAFLELLQEKPLEKITVVDITTRADLSRNTFYTHYQDIYAILEEYQNTMLAELDSALTEATAQHTPEDTLHLLLKIVQHLEENQATYRTLMRTSYTGAFVRQLKQRLPQHVSHVLGSGEVSDSAGLQILLSTLSSGFVDLVVAYLENKTDLSLSEIAQQMHRIYLAALPLYV